VKSSRLGGAADAVAASTCNATDVARARSMQNVRWCAKVLDRLSHGAAGPKGPRGQR
jgi:hypothetical protein